jgi:hypothetical protein
MCSGNIGKLLHPQRLNNQPLDLLVALLLGCSTTDRRHQMPVMSYNLAILPHSKRLPFFQASWDTSRKNPSVQNAEASTFSYVWRLLDTEYLSQPVGLCPGDQMMINILLSGGTAASRVGDGCLDCFA